VPDPDFEIAGRRKFAVQSFKDLKIDRLASRCLFFGGSGKAIP
jgi:hypothetical protein